MPRTGIRKLHLRWSRAVMTAAGQPASELSLTYYGHCAFLWESGEGVRVLADPYRNRRDRYWFTRRFPEVACDLGLITHAHFDHAAAERLPETASLIRMPGEFSHRDVRVRGVQDIHSGASGLRDFPNVMFRLDTGGVSFLHLGDNRADWPAAVARGIGDIDVLLVTVDGSNHLLTYEEVDGLVTRLSPRVVIPMHYQIPGLMAETTGLGPPEGWLATQRAVRRLDSHRAVITASGLPSRTEVWVFQPSPDSMSAPTVVP